MLNKKYIVIAPEEVAKMAKKLGHDSLFIDKKILQKGYKGKFKLTKELATQKAEEKALEVDKKFLNDFVKKFMKRYKINYCPCCFADLPPNHTMNNEYRKRNKKNGNMA